MKHFFYCLMAILCLLGVVSTAEAQSDVLDNNPSSTRWRQINTPNFKVIYPLGLDKEGQRVANTLQHIHTPASENLGRAPRKIPIVLQMPMPFPTVL